MGSRSFFQFSDVSVDSTVACVQSKSQEGKLCVCIDTQYLRWDTINITNITIAEIRAHVRLK